MTAPHIVDPPGVLREALSDASPDLMCSLLQTMINALLGADVDAVVGAEYGKPMLSEPPSATATAIGPSIPVWAPSMLLCRNYAKAPISTG